MIRGEIGEFSFTAFSIFLFWLFWDFFVWAMRNDGQKLQGGVPRSSSSSGRSNGFFPTIRSYLKIVSSGASSVASTVRSASASVASSIVEREEDASRDQVQWAGFDKLESGADITRQVLLLGYRSGFQVWDVEEGDDVHELVSRHDGPVSFMQVQPKPLVSNTSTDKFADVRPLLAVAVDGLLSVGGTIPDGSSLDGGGTGFNEMGNGNFVPTVVHFYSLRTYSYVHVLKFRTVVYSVRCSSRVVAISQAAQIHCFNAATLEREYTILTYPIVSGCLTSGCIGYGPLAVGSRWLAYTGSPVAVSNASHVSPQHLTPAPSLSSSSSNGSLVAYYAKESSKQLAAGIVTLGDMGYQKLSRYCSKLLPDCNNSIRAGSPNGKLNGTVNGYLPDAENVGTVIIRDIVSKSVVSQFRAHKSPISTLCFDPSGTLLVTASVQGHNINVFQIMPIPLEGSSGFDAAGSHVHLYRLQRGMTNAVIQDISFSDDSQCIMISSSRGTSHIFAISPSGGAINLHMDNSSVMNGRYGKCLTAKQAVRWPPSLGPLKSNQQSLSASGPPVTLSVVSRIKNGNNSWKGTVSGAAAAATGRVSSLSGAIASVFHGCKGKNLYLDNSSSRTTQHLLVFSPSGCVIQYVLRLSTGMDAITDVSGLTTAHYESAPDTDARLFVEALQKWDVCQKQNRREREDNVDIYGDHWSGDGTKLFPKGVRKGTSVYSSDNHLVRNVKQTAEDKHHLYISESELQTHAACVLLWEKPEMYFQMMLVDGVETENGDIFGGEIEIERVSTCMVEARSKDLVPVFDHLQTPKFQSSVYALDGHWNGPPLLHQRSGQSEDGRFSQRSGPSLFDGLSEGAAVTSELHNGIEENGWGNLHVSTDSPEGFVNNKDSQRVKAQLEFVNNRESSKMEAELKFVHNKESPRMETHFEADDNDLD